MNGLNHAFSVAPMMDCTDRHCRFLLRLISRRAVLYTEMVTANAIVRGRDPDRFLAFDPAERPLVLQLGGSDPELLVAAAKRAENFGYDEINLNVGCPSDRVTSGRFGACLMAEPELVAACVAAMRAAVKIPVTVKTRTGIAETRRDRAVPVDHLAPLVAAVARAGCDTFIIHARAAWLEGLSPKENREIPPLDYARVRRLKQEQPQLTVILNGGLKSLEAAHEAMSSGNLDGVMLGRAAYETPNLLAGVDRMFYGDATPPAPRAAVVEAYAVYAATEIARGARPTAVLRHLSGLFHGGIGARRWRQQVSRAGQGEVQIAELVTLAAALDRPEALAA